MTIPDDPNTVCGYWFLNTGKNDYFIPACEFHDKAYTKGSWHQKHMTRKEVDDKFLEHMLLLAGNDLTKKAKAYLFYGIVRSVGGIFWDAK